MRVASAAALAVFVLAATAAAEDTARPSAADRTTISACLKAADGDRARESACIGKVQAPCMERSEGLSNHGMADCARREAAIWDDLLNGAYRRIQDAGTAAVKKGFRDAQRAWIAFRDADCRLPFDVHEGGSMAVPMSADCVLRHTASRALDLMATEGEVTGR